MDSFDILHKASRDRWGTNNYGFCYSRIRTLVAMATYSYHRPIMGKVEIGNFCLGIFEFL